MSRRVFFTVFLLVAAATGLAVTLMGPATAQDYAAAAYLFVALSIVGAMDVWLPRGDYSDMGAALVFASGLLLSPALAAGVVVFSRILAWVTRKPREGTWQVFDDVVRRVAQMSWSLAFFWLIGGTTPLNSAGDQALFLRVLAAAVVFFALEFVIAQLGSSLRLETPFVPLVVGNIQLQGWASAAQMSAAVLAVITYQSMQVLGIAIVAGLLLVMRQSFALLVEVRQAFRSTIEALARSIEAHDARRRGHAERVARLATEAGRLLGLHGKQLEALTYAALFHDVGVLDVDADGVKGSAPVLESVSLLSSSVPILRIIDERGGAESSQQEEHLVAAYVVARMCEQDDRNHGRDVEEKTALADAVGARLYATTRGAADRAVARAVRRAEAGRLAEPIPAGGTSPW